MQMFQAMQRHICNIMFHIASRVHYVQLGRFPVRNSRETWEDCSDIRSRYCACQSPYQMQWLRQRRIPPMALL